MRRPYDPTELDPLGIHAACERERRASRFRDSRSREKIHAIDADVGGLIHFVASRRRRQPDAMNLLRRVLQTLDTPAIRLLLVMVLTKGACDRVQRAAQQAGFRTMPLVVAGAFHSPIMQTAADRMGAKLQEVPIQAPRPILTGADCRGNCAFK